MTGPRKPLGGPFNAWLRSPELAGRLQQLGEYIRFKTLLHHRLNEFAILIIAHDSGSQYEWYAHYPLAIKAGLDEKVAAELAEGKRPSGMKDDEVLVYDFSTQPHHKHNVDDDLQSRGREARRAGRHGSHRSQWLLRYLSMTLNVAQVRPPEPDKVPIAQK